MKMNKKFLWIIPILLLVSIILVVIKNVPNQKFYLEDKYYGNSDFIEIETSDIEKLINDKESFALFIYQPACANSSNFEQVLKNFSRSNNIEIYKIAFSDIKDTDLNKHIKYYPSFAIFKKGKMIDYLDANSDKDLKYYKSKDGFTEWFTSYVKLREINQNENNLNNSENKEDNTVAENTEDTHTEVSLEDVSYDQNKVNIYFFWGSTCPHCKAEFAFFDDIEKEYGSYYNLYTYEVWENPANAEIMNKFASALNEEVTGVPYTIIGDASFSGFGESSKEEFIEAIKNKHQNSTDVYFDKIKNKE